MANDRMMAIIMRASQEATGMAALATSVLAPSPTIKENKKTSSKSLLVFRYLSNSDPFRMLV